MAERAVIGWREWVRLPDVDGVWIKAKVDTGARSSALHAWDIDDRGDGTIEFTLHPIQRDDTTSVRCSAPLLEHRSVRSSNGEIELRPVVSLDVEVRGSRSAVEVTLTRRDEMGFRMLLGRRALRRRFVVDPARSFVGGGCRVAPP